MRFLLKVYKFAFFKGPSAFHTERVKRGRERGNTHGNIPTRKGHLHETLCERVRTIKILVKKEKIVGFHE